MKLPKREAALRRRVAARGQRVGFCQKAWRDEPGRKGTLQREGGLGPGPLGLGIAPRVRFLWSISRRSSILITLRATSFVRAGGRQEDAMSIIRLIHIKIDPSETETAERIWKTVPFEQTSPA